MNIAIVLDYFKYFLPFSLSESANKYFYTTQRSRFDGINIPNFSKFNLNQVDRLTKKSIEDDPEFYFKATKPLDAIKQNLDVKYLAAAYEDYFHKYFDQFKIDLLISGAVTGFERCGLHIARKASIKTLCVWEGFFRPSTVSCDPIGMNAESDFYTKSWSEIESHVPSDRFKKFYAEFKLRLSGSSTVKKSLKEIQQDKFDFKYQLKNRFADRNDLERIRLPIMDHITARLSYYLNQTRYKKVEAIDSPFIFSPLQTHTDSNIVINSPLFPFDKYVDFLQRSFSDIYKIKKCKLVIKEHPFDIFRKKYYKQDSDYIIWLDPSVPTEKIFNHAGCLGTVVVNSTAGFESLILGKPVLTLGESIYSRPELTVGLKDFTGENFKEKIFSLIDTKVVDKNVEQFASFLFDKMQFEGNIDYLPESSEIKRFEQLIQKMFV